MTEAKAVRWHRLPFGQFVVREAKRPMFQPFLIGAAYVPLLYRWRCIGFTRISFDSIGLCSISFVVCGILPASGASQEDKEKSKYWQRLNGKIDHSAH